MRNHRGGAMRRDPRFDSLEQRSLLSGGFPIADIHPGGFVSPQFQMDHVNSPFPVDHGFSVIVIFRSGSPFPSGQSWPSLSSDYQMPDSDGSMQGQPPAAGPGQFSGNMADPTGGQVLSRNEPGPIAPFPVSSAPSFGLPAVVSPKSQSGTVEGVRDGAERISGSAGPEGIAAGPDGVSVTAGKEVAQEASGIGNGQLEPAVAGLPAQLGVSENLWRAKSLKNARLIDCPIAERWTGSIGRRSSGSSERLTAGSIKKPMRRTAGRLSVSPQMVPRSRWVDRPICPTRKVPI